MNRKGLTMNETTRRIEHNPLSTLYLTFELGNKQWKLGFTIGLAPITRNLTKATT
jgi:hypothetical protein